MMDSPSFLFGEMKEDFGNSVSLVRNRIGELETPGDVVRERKGEIGNPNFVRERNAALENYDSLTKRNGNLMANGIGVIERETEMDPPDRFGEKIEGTENDNNVVEDMKCEVETSKSLVLVGKRDPETPPVDDCCPICFGSFTIPFKTDCGHWFCANCILQLWNYRESLQQCKCPICCRLINKLTPEASLVFQQEEEVIEAFKNVQRYNRLFVGGAHGLLLKMFELPLVSRRMFWGLMDPDRFRFNYYTVRLVALLLSCIYNVSRFDFIPTGGLGIRRLFDFCSIALVVILCLVGICRRLLLRRRMRLLAATQL